MNWSSAVPESPVQRLVLGGAGLGMAYGRPENAAIAPAAPDAGRVRDTLAAAWELGIRTIDTAPAYGASEALIGRHWPGAVWTKTGFDDSLSDSLTALRCESVELVQWHNWDPTVTSDARWPQRWQALTQDPRIQRLGATVYGSAAGLAAIDDGFASVQLPWNVLDQQPAAALSTAARKAGVRLCARSVYLQGLLAGRQAPAAQQQTLAPLLQAVQQRAADYGLSSEVFALRASLDCPYLDSIVVGCDHPQQVAVLGQALAAAPVGPHPDLCHSGLSALDPRTW